MTHINELQATFQTVPSTKRYGAEDAEDMDDESEEYFDDEF